MHYCFNVEITKRESLYHSMLCSVVCMGHSSTLKYSNTAGELATYRVSYFKVHLSRDIYICIYIYIYVELNEDRSHGNHVGRNQVLLLIVVVAGVVRVVGVVVVVVEVVMLADSCIRP